MGKPVILRCPIIPQCNDCEEHYAVIAALANEMDNITEVHIEPYHPLGVDKYPPLGMKAAYTNGELMDKAESERIAERVRSMTGKPVKIS